MTVAKFTQPNFTSQTASQYKTNIDASIQVLAEMAANFAPHAADTPNMTVVVDAGKLWTGSVYITKSQQTTAAITAPTTNPRIDRVCLDTAGDVAVVTGTEAATPTAPDIPAGYFPICQFQLETSTAQITNSMIVEERPVVVLPTSSFVVKNWSLHDSAADNFWSSISWSETLGLFAAVSLTGVGNRVMTSPDGINWTLRSSPADLQWTSVCWSDGLGLFAAVAKSGSPERVMTSADGINWTLRSSVVENWESLAWSEKLGLFAAVGTSGTSSRVMTSPDGINWTPRNSPIKIWQSIAWSKKQELFVAVAIDVGTNSIMTSPDGINWTLRSHTSSSFLAVGSGGYDGLFVAIGANLIFTSLDGITWTERVSPSNSQWRAIEWSDGLGLFVALASTGKNAVMVSTDGVEWKTNSAKIMDWRSVSWSKNLSVFAAVSGNSSNNKVMTSFFYS